MARCMYYHFESKRWQRNRLFEVFCAAIDGKQRDCLNTFVMDKAQMVKQVRWWTAHKPSGEKQRCMLLTPQGSEPMGLRKEASNKSVFCFCFSLNIKDECGLCNLWIVDQRIKPLFYPFQGWFSPGQVFVLDEYCARYGVRGCHRHLCYLYDLLNHAEQGLMIDPTLIHYSFAFCASHTHGNR